MESSSKDIYRDRNWEKEHSDVLYEFSSSSGEPLIASGGCKITTLNSWIGVNKSRPEMNSRNLKLRSKSSTSTAIIIITIPSSADDLKNWKKVSFDDAWNGKTYNLWKRYVRAAIVRSEPFFPLNRRWQVGSMPCELACFPPAYVLTSSLAFFHRSHAVYVELHRINMQ